MRRIFVTTKEFDKLWKSLGNSDSELRILENELIYDTLKGKVINGTEGLRKLRWQIKGKGKRGGIRILYVDFQQDFIKELIYSSTSLALSYLK